MITVLQRGGRANDYCTPWILGYQVSSINCKFQEPFFSEQNCLGRILTFPDPPAISFVLNSFYLCLTLSTTTYMLILHTFLGVKKAFESPL